MSCIHWSKINKYGCISAWYGGERDVRRQNYSILFKMKQFLILSEKRINEILKFKCSSMYIPRNFVQLMDSFTWSPSFRPLEFNHFRMAGKLSLIAICMVDSSITGTLTSATKLYLKKRRRIRKLEITGDKHRTLWYWVGEGLGRKFYILNGDTLLAIRKVRFKYIKCTASDAILAQFA